MSFSSDAKAELCQAKIEKKCCAVAESYGVLLYCNTFSPREIRIITASADFAARLPKMFKKAFATMWRAGNMCMLMSVFMINIFTV